MLAHASLPSLSCSLLAALRAALLSLFLVLAACGGSSSGEGSYAKVLRVVDGDTVRLSGVGKVRLIGVDTPEVSGRDECFGREASAFTGRVLRPGTSVRYRLGVEEHDRYGRALAYLYLADGRLFNELLVASGYAQPLTVPPNDELADRFVEASRRARERRLGLWRACDFAQRAR